MSNLELVALIVKDYDLTIRFFVDVLQFELIEDTHRSPTTVARNAGSSSGRPKGRLGFYSRELMASIRLAPSGSSSPDAWASSSGWMTSMRPTNG